MLHRCPISVCGVQIPTDRLCCKTHWFMVPAHLRSEVWRTYNQFRDRPGYDPNRIKQLRDAQKKAIEAVEAKIRGVAA